MTTTLALLLAGAAGLVVATLLAVWVVEQVGATRLWRVESVVAPVVVGVGVLACGWVALSALVAGVCAGVRTAGGTWRGGEVAVRRWAPGLVRRALAVALVAGVGLGTAAGAHAATVPPDPAPAAVAVDLGWAPTAPGPTDAVQPSVSPATAPTTPTADREGPATAPAAPVAEAAPAASHGDPTLASVAPVAAPVPTAADAPAAPRSAPPPPARPAAHTVEVQPGDTLWAVAARSLGPDASDAAIAAEWPRWYAANASVIGPDPDLLQPGQVLVAPAATDGNAS